MAERYGLKTPDGKGATFVFSLPIRNNSKIKSRFGYLKMPMMDGMTFYRK
jgi:hypothetical protein